MILTKRFCAGASCGLTGSRDDGLIPNHPKWPLIIYKSAIRLPEALNPAAVFEDLF